VNRDLADFDDYVDQYDDLLKNQLSFFEGNRTYFSRYKVKLLHSLLDKSPEKLLDFGSGIGLSLPHFLYYFPHSEICATDISKKSLTYLSKHYSDVKVYQDEELEGQTFDLIFLSGVMHHIPPEKRPTILKRLKTLLSPEGSIIIFEHNPFNPVTQRMVATCPFDEGVQLLSKSALQKMMKKEGFHVDKGGYTLFFPEPLKFFRPLEQKLYWCPLGGQYFVMARR
jgi:SAM-dependent methyltransferase